MPCGNHKWFVYMITLVSTIYSYTPVDESTKISNVLCFPTLSCNEQCPQNEANKTSSTSNNTCNLTFNSATNNTRCLCQATACYSTPTFCLHACDDHSIEDITACMTCLNYVYDASAIMITQENYSCESVCMGMCPDPSCALSAPNGSIQNCISCAQGFQGMHCQDQCPPGCPGECHDVSGYCMACPTGTYGPECELDCPSGCLYLNCSTVWGTCDKCNPGLQGDTCEEVCPDGRYGDNCTNSCSSHCKEGLCDAIEGLCSYGCLPGYFGQRCDQPCPAEYFGQDCLSHCPVTCADDRPCHHATGECVAGCTAGFYGATCNMTCRERTFGANCAYNCSEHCFRELCNAFSGICLTCRDKYYGPLCQFHVNIDKIKHGVLGSEVSSGEAVLMIGGIALVGVFMWVAVAYLLLQQRKRILKDAAKGIDPRSTQWGMFPNSRGFRKALRLYDNTLTSSGGGDTGSTSKRKRHKDTPRPPFTHNKKRRSVLSKLREEAANVGLSSLWTRKEAEKPELPDSVDKELVAGWLARHHGTQESSEAIRIAESPIAQPRETVREEVTPRSDKVEKSGSQNIDMSLRTDESKSTANENKAQESTTPQVKEILSNVMETAQDNTFILDGSQTGLEAPSLPTATQRSEKKPVQESQPSASKSLQEEIFHSSVMQRPSYEEMVNNLGIRKDTILLSPQAYPIGATVEPVSPKYGREVQWHREQVYVSSSSNRPVSASEREDSSTTETTTVSTESTEMTTTSTSGGTDNVDSITVTDTNVTSQTRTNVTSHTRRSDTEYTKSSTGDSFDSDSSYESTTTEESSSSTIISVEKTHKVQGQKIPLQSNFEDETSSAQPMKRHVDTDTTTDGLEVPSSIMQKLVGAFKRFKGKRPENPSQTVTPVQPPSVPGAGGLPRPYSHKFLFTRLETWNRNRGLEVNINDGMQEVAGPGVGHRWTSESSPRRGLVRDSFKTDRRPRMDMDVTDETSSDSNPCSSNKQTSGVTESGPRQNVTVTTIDDRDSGSRGSWSTVKDDQSGSTSE